MRAGLGALAALIVLAVLLPGVQAQERPVLVARVEGEITRATVEYVKAAIEVAESENARALVIRLDTPGGGLDETQQIQRMFLATPIPILGWVAPSGVSAWSAGTILLESSDLAAMAPFTTIGSVQPVGITPGGFVPITEAKILNAIEGSLREQLLMHGRNESLAAAFVRDNLNLNATQALAANAIELVADSVPSLLTGAQGRTLQAKNITLDLTGAPVREFNEPLTVALYSILANPVVSGLLLLLGIYAVIFGISAPGHGAEIVGTVMIALGVLGLGLSPNLVGVFLLLLGIVFLIVEAKTPGFGVWGSAGVVCIVLGTVFLAPVAPPPFLLSRDAQMGILAALLAPTAAFGGFLLFGMFKVMQVRKRKPAVGQLIGEEAEAIDPIPKDGRGYVMFQGEMWLATASEDVQPGERVAITAKDGFLLTIRKRSAETSQPSPAGRPPVSENSGR